MELLLPSLLELWLRLLRSLLQCLLRRLRSRFLFLCFLRLDERALRYTSPYGPPLGAWRLSGRH